MPFVVSSLFVLAGANAFAGPPDDEDKPSPKMRMYDFAPSAAEGIGVTPGGAQDINYARDRIKAGEVPHSNTFTPEGLFSQHDLPGPQKAKCKQTICLAGTAMPAQLVAQSDVRYLGQLGFSSDIKAKTFKREPVNLVMVVDVSGSMTGSLELVKDSLNAVVDQLGKGDQMSIVTYGSVGVVELKATANKGKMRRAIQGLQNGGSTAMEDGLQKGYELARQTKRGFKGQTRVMLFTDERPNVGRTDKGSFMQMAESASNDDIGMTTVGVSTHFGAELATAISSVRGGNLFFFPDVGTMTDTFEEEFDFMVTELGYDMKLTLSPGKNLKITGVYGIPGDKLQWDKGGDALSVEIATLFASKRNGAIFVSYGPKDPNLPLAAPTALGFGNVVYEGTDGKKHTDTVTFTVTDPAKAGIGLRRGHILVNQATALAAAADAHHKDNDQEAAYQLVRAIADIHRANRMDSSLAKERETVFKLEDVMAEKSGHAGEGGHGNGGKDVVSGLPRRH